MNSTSGYCIDALPPTISATVLSSNIQVNIDSRLGVHIPVSIHQATLRRFTWLMVHSICRVSEVAKRDLSVACHRQRRELDRSTRRPDAEGRRFFWVVRMWCIAFSGMLPFASEYVLIFSCWFHGQSGTAGNMSYFSRGLKQLEEWVFYRVSLSKTRCFPWVLGVF